MIPELDNITEEQLDAVYIYLSMEWDNMSDDDKLLWTEIIEKLDKNDYETDNGDNIA
jgi:hypothetical protein